MAAREDRLSSHLTKYNFCETMCFLGWAICGGLLPQSSMANIWDSREDAELRIRPTFIPTNSRGLDQIGNILRPPWNGIF